MKPGSAGVPYFAALDSLRGLCAVMVVLFHFRANSHLEDLAVIRNSWLFVDFFFVLSGFVIAANYGAKLRSRKVTIWRFMGLRLARLYPLHLAVLALFVATEALMLALHPWISSELRLPFVGERTLQLLPENVFLLQSLGSIFGMSGVQSWNGPAWSISAEVWIYLVFALSVFFGRWAVGAFRVLAIVAVPLAILFFNGGFLGLEFQGGVFRCAFGFALGSVLWGLFQKTTKLPNWLARVELPVIAAMFVFVAIAPTFQVTLLAPLVFGVVVWVFAAEKGLISRVLISRGFLLLGTLSYSIYMVHIYLHARLKNVATLVEDNSGWNIYANLPDTLVGTSVWFGDLFVLMGLILTVAVSFVTWKYVEIPGQKMVRGWIIPAERQAV